MAVRYDCIKLEARMRNEGTMTVETFKDRLNNTKYNINTIMNGCARFFQQSY